MLTAVQIFTDFMDTIPSWEAASSSATACLIAKFLLTLASTVILGPESHGTHDYILLSHGSGSLQTTLLLSHSRTSQHFIEHEGSLPCSQEPSTGSCLKPDQSSTYHPILRSFLISHTHLHLNFPSGLFPSGFLTKTLYAFLFSPCILHVLPFSFSFTWLF
jgi:hypothetical protein